MTEITFYGNTDTGKKRAKNEDSLWPAAATAPAEHATSRWGRLFIVADGMGGYGAGNIASQIAVETIRTVYYDDQTAGTTPAERLQQAIEAAHQSIKSEAQTSDSKARMGTTVVAVVIQNKQLWGAWVGDSRAYLLRDRRLRRLTKDHTVLWEQVQAGLIGWDELHYHPDRSKLNNSLTARREQVTADYLEAYPLQEGDRILLCSDGLSSEVRDEEIEQILRAAPPQETTQSLIKAANRPKAWLRDGQPFQSGGGEDNITALVIDMPGVRPAAAAGGFPYKWVGLVLAAAVLILLIGAGALFLLAAGIGAPQSPAAPPAAVAPTGSSPATGEIAIDLGQSLTTPTATVQSAGETLPAPTASLAAGETPRPTSTLAAFDTPTPIPSSTPTPRPTATPSVTATSAPVMTDTVTALLSGPELVEPPDGQVFARGRQSVTFRWRYGSDCDLPQNQGFQLRVWRAGELAKGAMDAREEQDKITCANALYTFVVGDLQSAPGVAGALSGKFFWDVLLVDLEPYREHAPESALASSFELGSDASSGGSDGGNGGDSGGPSFD